MKSFRTDFTLKADLFLDQTRSLLTLGSCFAEHVGQRLINAKWQGLNAPFGTLFHPLALAKLLRLASENRDLPEDLFVEHDGAFYHHDLHGRFHAVSPEDLQRQWRVLAAEVRELIARNPCVLLTLGTAWIYEKSGTIVANCHKQGAALFQKRLLTSAEIQMGLDEISALLPNSDIIVSLSPVRHTRDTMVLNSLSKSLLLVEIHRYCQRHPERVRYFPAYEIMLDDLRDYRFYEADMIHPSIEAIDYIWEKFIEAYCHPSTRDVIRRWQAIQKFLEHKPQRADAPSYQKHLQAVLEEINSYKEPVKK